MIKRMIRENYMKLFDETTKTFYYLNTRTGATSEQRPVFLRDDRDDLPIEMFFFRKAVCKLTSSSNRYGSASSLVLRAAVPAHGRQDAAVMRDRT
ncbi:hypothetical protein PINS_up020818 [Pythium insidiosum]|nr:hypothetical protein PINS_up020818 [Pythium insidiosum]